MIVGELKNLMGEREDKVTEAYVEVDSTEPIEEEPTAVELIRIDLGPAVGSNEEECAAEVEDVKTEEEKIKASDVIEAIDLIDRYCSQQVEDARVHDHIWALRVMIKQLIPIPEVKKQQGITNYFSSK